MSDNITITPGAGAVVATDECTVEGAVVQVQRIKLTFGTEGVAADVTAANPLPVYNANALPAGTNAVGSVTLKDGVVGNLATIAVFHSNDNQQPGGTAYGLLTGGVAQLLNRAGNLDRQRETGTDGIAAQGVATGTAQLGSPFSVSITAPATITGGVAGQTVTVSATSGTTARGASPWSIQVGSVLNVDSGANQETVVVTAVPSSTTISGVFLKTHTAPITATGKVYNEARDATVSDGSSGQGFAAGATYLFNSQLNSGAGGWESERSAAGELDGASGYGTAVAAEYEFNGQLFDRARSLQGKGLVSTTLSSLATAPLSSLSLTSVNGLTPGQPIWLEPGTGNFEQVYVSPSWNGSTTVALNVITSITGSSTNTSPTITGVVVPAGSVVQNGMSVSGTGIPTNTILIAGAGSSTWTLSQNSTSTVGSLAITVGATNFTHANGSAVKFEDFSAAGPGTNGFLPVGIGLEETALYNPVDGLFYIERSATGDGVAGANIVMENPALYNGVTFDRRYNNTVGTILASSARNATTASTVQTNFNARGVILTLNVTAASGTGGLTLRAQGVDPVSAATYNLNTAPTAVIATGITSYVLFPGVTGGGVTQATSSALPRTWQVSVSHGDGTSYTYSVGYAYVL